MNLTSPLRTSQKEHSTTFSHVDSEVPTPEELYITNPKRKSAVAFVLDDTHLSPRNAARGGAASPQSGQASPSPTKKKAGSISAAGGDLLGGEKFPAYDELQLLPQEIQKTLLRLVMDFFRKMLYPQVVLMQRKKQRKQAIEAVRNAAPHVPVPFLQTVPLFARWNNLESLSKSMELRVYERDELLVMENDATQSGIIFLVQGSVQIRKRRVNAKRKGFNDLNTQAAGNIEAPSVYGEMIFLTEEPRMASLKATTRCFVRILTKDNFFRHLNQLSEDRRRQVVDFAHERRRDLMPQCFPVNGAMLKRVPLFSAVPLANLDAVAAKLEPRVYAEDRVVCNIGDTATDMYFIARGVVEIYSGSVSEGAEVLQSTARTGQIVGEMAVLFSQKRNVRLRCVTACDLYSVSRDALTAAINNNSIMGAVLQKAHALQAEWQHQAKTQYREFISHVPFIQDFASEKMLDELLECFKGRVYPIHSTVISVSEVADRLIIMTRGRARATTNNTDMQQGECIGFTCLIPHRWTYHVTALETVECIELPFPEFKRILKKFDHYERVKELSLGLLYPRVHPDRFQEALGMIRHCRNPPTFPTSSDTEQKPFGARTNANTPTPLPIRRTKTDTGVYTSYSVPKKLAPLFNPQSVSAAHNAQQFVDEVYAGNWRRDESEPNSMSLMSSSVAPGGNGASSPSRTRSVLARSLLSSSNLTGSPNAKDPNKSEVQPKSKAQAQREYMSRLATKNSTKRNPGASQSRAAADVERLSKRILELQMSLNQSPQKNHYSPGKKTPTRLPPINATSPTSEPGSPTSAPTSVTVGTQTTKSYLTARAKMLSAMTEEEREAYEQRSANASPKAFDRELSRSSRQNSVVEDNSLDNKNNNSQQDDADADAGPRAENLPRDEDEDGASQTTRDPDGVSQFTLGDDGQSMAGGDGDTNTISGDNQSQKQGLSQTHQETPQATGRTTTTAKSPSQSLNTSRSQNNADDTSSRGNSVERSTDQRASSATPKKETPEEEAAAATTEGTPVEEAPTSSEPAEEPASSEAKAEDEGESAAAGDS